MIIAVVGAGGKTTKVHQLAKEAREKGQKVFVTTSTHMWIEDDTLCTGDSEKIIKELEETGYVMAGIPIGKKIGPLSKETYEAVCPHADVVLIEADGSKQLPLKFPAEWEPVIYENVDEIRVICGLNALHQRFGDVTHRMELVEKVLHVTEDTLVEPEHIQELLRKGYLEPLRKRYPDKKILLDPRCDDSEEQRKLAELLQKEQDVSVLRKPKTTLGCVIMASGLSKRFGKNKLLEEFQGKTLLQRILDTTEGVFEKRVVVTRNQEVSEICKEKQIPVILHEFEGRNDTVRLGTTYLEEMDGVLFCPCDQPLLKRRTLKRMRVAFEEEKHGIFRVCHGDTKGTPILFGKEFYKELCNLPPKKGGSYLLRQHEKALHLIEVEEEAELLDIDTQEDFKRLLQLHGE